MAYEEQQIHTKEVRRINMDVEEQSIEQQSNNESVIKAEKVAYLIYGILAGLLALRFVLSLLGANRANTFADAIYSITGPLVAPFRGLFNIDTTYGVSRFDLEGLIAMIVYGFIAWAIIKAINLNRQHNTTN